jgi:hypothetical protein
MRRHDAAGGEFERCEQGRGAVPLVVVALAVQGASVRQLQMTLRSLQGLDRRLFDAKGQARGPGLLRVADGRWFLV